MKNRYKALGLFVIGFGIPFIARTTLVEYEVDGGGVSPFLTEYLYSTDIFLTILLALYIWKTKQLPFSNYSFLNSLGVAFFIYLGLGLYRTDYPLLGLISLIRGYILFSLIWFWYFFYRQQSKPWLSYIGQGFIIAMLCQLGVVWAQIMTQQQLGLPLVIEPVLSPLLAGVAKFSFLGETFIRPTGTFPHPNILGFASVISLSYLYSPQLTTRQRTSLYLGLILAFASLDHYILTSPQALLITTLIALLSLSKKSPTLRLNNLGLSIGILHILAIFSLSRTAITLLLLLDISSLTFQGKFKLFHVEQFEKIKSGLAEHSFAILVGLSFLVKWITWQDSFQKRLLYVKDALEIIQANPWFGVGLKHYVANLSSLNREFWQFEPVHNLGLLVLSELGLVGLSFILIIALLLIYQKLYAKL